MREPREQEEFRGTYPALFNPWHHLYLLRIMIGAVTILQQL